MMVAVNEDLTEVSLIVQHHSPITEEQFMDCVIQFYQHCTDLDFSKVIGNLKEEDKSLN